MMKNFQKNNDFSGMNNQFEKMQQQNQEIQQYK